MSDKQNLTTDDLLKELQTMRGLSNVMKASELGQLTAYIKNSQLVAGDLSLEAMNNQIEEILNEIEKQLEGDQKKAVEEYREALKNQLEITTLEASDLLILVKGLSEASTSRLPFKLRQIKKYLQGRQIVGSDNVDPRDVYIMLNELSKKHPDDADLQKICNVLESRVTNLIRTQDQKLTTTPAASNVTNPSNQTTMSSSKATTMPSPHQAPKAIDPNELAQQIINSPERKAELEARNQKLTALIEEVRKLTGQLEEQKAQREAEKAELSRQIEEAQREQAMTEARKKAEQRMGDEDLDFDRQFAELTNQVGALASAVQQTSEPDEETKRLKAELAAVKTGKTTSSSKAAIPLDPPTGSSPEARGKSAILLDATDPFGTQETDRLNIDPIDASTEPPSEPETENAPIADTGLTDDLGETGEFDLGEIDDLSVLDDDPLFNEKGALESAIVALNKLEQMKLNETEVAIIAKANPSVTHIADVLNQSVLLDDSDFEKAINQILKIQGVKEDDELNFDELNISLKEIMTFCEEIRIKEVPAELEPLAELVKNGIQEHPDHGLLEKLDSYSQSDKPFAKLMKELRNNRELNKEQDDAHLLYGIRLAVAAHTDKAPTNDILVKVFGKLKEIVARAEAELKAEDTGISAPNFGISIGSDIHDSNTPISNPPFARGSTAVTDGEPVPSDDKDTKPELPARQIALVRAIQENGFFDTREINTAQLEVLLNECTDSEGNLNKQKADRLARERHLLKEDAPESVWDDIESRADASLDPVHTGQLDQALVRGAELSDKSDKTTQNIPLPQVQAKAADYFAQQREAEAAANSPAPGPEMSLNEPAHLTPAPTFTDQQAPARAEASMQPGETQFNDKAEIEAQLVDRAMREREAATTPPPLPADESDIIDMTEEVSVESDEGEATSAEADRGEAELLTTLAQISQMPDARRQDIMNKVGRRSPVTSALKALPDTTKAMSRLRSLTGLTDAQIMSIHLAPALTAVQQ